VAAVASRVCIRSAAASRTVFTNLVSTVTPGSNTKCRRSQPTPGLEQRRQALIQRPGAAIQEPTELDAHRLVLEHRNPYASRISQACS